ncbi:hypothetical protein [Nocardia rhizosphaerihabitans]|uniref:Uncharacterized protein n=1 Tax=Nocardia rhizosphaerihabitans TaxID=1691570 RepID=A0ABQ2KMK1_9NOCA|nr:hypothetical protein [Nocardia rhizosphaerihabitans]GGN84375.1 hypothetical protein GCM10011610_37620 [Nocardia rhizosphaerihabitans]
MGIDVIIQNQVHKQMEVLTGSALESLSSVVSTAPSGSLLWGIHKHADTMFNAKQLDALIEEIAALSPRNDLERELFAILSNAAEFAIRQRGYIWFSGD